MTKEATQEPTTPEGPFEKVQNEEEEKEQIVKVDDDLGNETDNKSNKSMLLESFKHSNKDDNIQNPQDEEQMYKDEGKNGDSGEPNTDRSSKSCDGLK